MTNYYVYMLLDPRKYYLPFYIGKGTGDRAYKHLRESRVLNENKKKASTVKAIRKTGKEPVVFFWKTGIENENEAYELEEYLIKSFGRRGIDKNGILTNICPDARPPVSRRIWSDEERKIFSESQKGDKNHRFGKVTSDEQKAKQRAANIKLGIRPPVRSGPMDETTKQKISAANKGKRKPEGFGDQVAERNRKRVVSDETKRRMREAHARRKELGIPSKPRRKLTEDEKLAISERVKKQWQSLDRRLKHSLPFYNKRNDIE